MTSGGDHRAAHAITKTSSVSSGCSPIQFSSVRVLSIAKTKMGVPYEEGVPYKEGGGGGANKEGGG